MDDGEDPRKTTVFGSASFTPDLVRWRTRRARGRSEVSRRFRSVVQAGPGDWLRLVSPLLGISWRSFRPVDANTSSPRDSASTKWELVRMDDRVVLVIGAASGIGLASAQLCAEAGALVMLADLDEASGLAAARAIDPLGGRTAFSQVDAIDEQSVSETDRGNRRKVWSIAGFG